jgi:hypothetical protein
MAMKETLEQVSKLNEELNGRLLYIFDTWSNSHQVKVIQKVVWNVCSIELVVTSKDKVSDKKESIVGFSIEQLKKLVANKKLKKDVPTTECETYVEYEII